MAGGWGKAEVTVNDHAAYGAKLREWMASEPPYFRKTVAEFRAHFGTSVTIGGEDVEDHDTVTFRQPEADGSVLTVVLPTVEDLNEMIAADPGTGPYELPDFYQEIFVKPVYADLSDPAARERVRNCRLAEYTTNKCH